jgi:thiamine-phosphate pyrophosphorylase
MTVNPSVLSRVLITDRALAGDRPLVEVAARAAERAAVTMIVVRELDLADDDQVRLVQEIAARVSVPVLLARNPALATRARAAGVQLGWGSPSPVEARVALGMGPLIGASVHSVEEGLQQAETGVDYLLLGPVFPTPKPHGLVFPVGVDAVRRLAGLTRTPVVAVGGLDLSHEEELRAAGAAGIAAIRAFMAEGVAGTAPEAAG